MNNKLDITIDGEVSDECCTGFIDTIDLKVKLRSNELFKNLDWPSFTFELSKKLGEAVHEITGTKSKPEENYRYQSAELKNKEEAIIRMVNGEKFYIILTHGSVMELYYNDNHNYENLFLSKWINSFGSLIVEPIVDSFINIDEWCVMVENEWYEADISKGILCWVWDYHDCEQDQMINIIVDKEPKGRFVSKSGVEWNYAKPLTAEELQGYLT